MNRRRLLLLAGALLLVVVLAVAALLLLRLPEPAPESAGPPAPAPPGPAAGWYEALFTTPQRTGTPPPGSPGRLDERLIGLIDGAQRTVDIAAYDFGLENVADAVLRARERGVRIRMVTDTDNLKEGPLQRVVKGGVPVVDDQRRAIMHHKFAVIDGETVLTGAWNFAERDTYRHNNNAVIFRSPELARNFANEFEKMFTARAFGPTKPKDIPNPVVTVGETRVEVWFASELDPTDTIVQRLRAAEDSIVFMAFSFTLDEVAAAMTERAGAGVGVWGVIEATGSETQYSEWGKLKSLAAPSPRPPWPGCPDGAAVLQDGNSFLLHHKVIVIDERTVLFGSFNFTSNAAEDNDEALLIVDDPALAQQFLGEFCRVYAVAVERARTRN